MSIKAVYYLKCDNCKNKIKLNLQYWESSQSNIECTDGWVESIKNNGEHFCPSCVKKGVNDIEK